MPVLGCGAEIGKLMDVSDQDVATIEEVIKERLEMGVSQAQAQRQAVDEALAQLADERSMVMKAAQDQLGFLQKESELEVSEESDPVAEEGPVVEDEPSADEVEPTANEEDVAPVEEAEPESDKPSFANKPQTDTPEFKKWFGDSKVVDADGKPLVVYHGTTYKSPIEAFDRLASVKRGRSASLDTVGSWFSSQPNRDGAEKYSGEGGAIYPVYLSIKNPKEMTLGEMRELALSFEEAGAKRVSETGATELREQLIYDGYDGIVIRATRVSGFKDVARINEEAASYAKRKGNPSLAEWHTAQAVRNQRMADDIERESGSEFDKQDVYIAFGPTQIKSATGNNGDFDGTNPDIRFANKPTPSKWRTELGAWKLGPGQMLLDAFEDRALPYLDRLQLTRPDKDTRIALRKMKVEVKQAMDVAAEMAGEVNKMPAAEREMVSDIIEKELNAGVTPPASAVRTATMMNAAFKTQTDELVRLGMLTKDAADRWEGKYLPRYYESKMGTAEDTFKVVSRDRKPGAGIKGQHLRGRGLSERIDVADLAEYQGKGWEVRDNAYDANTSTVVHVWRDFTKAEREKMGEIRDAGFRFVLGYMATQKDIALGRLYERFAGSNDWSASQATPEMPMMVPDGTAQGTGAKKFGKLGGRYVSTALWSQLSAQQELESDGLKLYRKALALWKEGKTVLNPVSHMNNFVSNMTNAHFAGVSYWRQDKYAGTIKDLINTAPMVKEANDNGLWLGTLSQEELGQMLPPDLQTLLAKQDSKTMTGMKMAYNVMTWGLRKPMGQAYEFGDKFFKYMIYKEARSKGLSPEDSVEYALKYIFNYDDLPATARKIRDYGLPFFSYTYKAIPMLAETALTRPDRMLAPAALLTVASMAAYAIAAGGEDEDDMESVKKYVTDKDFRKKADEMREREAELLPEWMKGRTSLGTPKLIRLGEDEETQMPVFLDTSRFIPGGDLFDLTGNSGGVPFIQPLTPSNPLLTTFGSMFLNRDMFTGKDLVNKDSDSGMEAGAKRAKWLYKMAAPAIAINQAHWDRAVQAVANQTTDGEIPGLPDFIGGKLTGVGNDGLPVQAKYAAMNTIGIKAKPQDLEFSATMQSITKKRTLKELEAELARARRLSSDGKMKERQLEQIRRTVQEKKDRIKEGLTVDGDDM